jgi:hypothetical protein
MDKISAKQSPAAGPSVSHNVGNISTINDYDHYYYDNRYNDDTA